MQRTRTIRNVTRRDLGFLAAGVALSFVVATAWVDDPADAVPAEPPAAPGEDTTFVPIDNCRLFDTRPDPALNVGPRSTPIGAGEVHRQQVTGDVGSCSIPPGATGVALNVTVVEPTAASFLTVYPYAPTPPNASSLNYVPGSPPTPNKVDVKLSPTGELGFYNLAGSAHVLADATGYYATSALDDIEDRLAQLEGAVDSLTSSFAEDQRHKVFAAGANSDGTRSGRGDFTSTRINTGQYQVSFGGLAEYDIAAIGLLARSAVVAVTPYCPGYDAAAAVNLVAELGSTWGTVTFDVVVTNAAGSVADCGFNLMATFTDPTPLQVVTPTGS